MPSQIRGLRRKSIGRDKVTTDDSTVSQVQIISNVATDMIGTVQLTVDDTAVPSGDTGIINTLLSWIANRIKGITGKPSWRTAPDRTLAQCVDSAGLTVDRVPNASGARTLSDSPIAVSSGNVGIGITSSLTGKLHVKSTDATAAVRVENTYSGNGVDVSMVGAGGGVAISHTGTGHGITMSKGSSGRGLHLTHSGSGDCLFVSNTNTGNGLVVTLTGSGKGAVITTLDTIGVQVSMSGNGSAADLVSIGHTGSSYTGNGYRATLTSSGHGVKVYQDGTGKGVEVVIYNGSNSTHGVDSYTNGTGDAVKGKSEGTGRAGYFERNNSTSPTGSVFALKAAHSTDAGTLLEANHIGTGKLADLQQNGTTKFSVDNKGITYLSGFAPKRAAVTGATHTITSDTVVVGVSPPTGGTTLTLPAASAVCWLIIKDEGGTAATRNITINRAGADTIQGATSITISTNRGQRVLYSDGAGVWHIVGS